MEAGRLLHMFFVVSTYKASIVDQARQVFVIHSVAGEACHR